MAEHESENKLTSIQVQVMDIFVNNNLSLYEVDRILDNIRGFFYNSRFTYSKTSKD